ncbi:MAG: hypothetical protein ACFE92_15005 [Promethearchaeota archaeon]
MNFKKPYRQFKKRWISLKEWPSLPRRWTKIKIVSKPILIITGLVLLFVPVYFDQVSLIKVYEGIELPGGPVSINLNFADPINTKIYFPFKIKNSGFHSLKNINLKIALKLDYTNKFSDQRTREVIFSANYGSFNLGIGKILSEVFYEDYSAFDWGNIGNFLNNVEALDNINVLMDLELSFYMSWVEQDKFIFSNINLTTNVEQEGIQYQKGSSYSSEPNLSRDIHYESKLWFLILTITALLLTYIRIGRRIMKSQQSSQRHIARHKGVRIAFLKVIAYSCLIITLDIYMFQSQKDSLLYSSDYVLRLEITLWISIIILFLITFFSVLPAFRPKYYKKYSVNDSIRSLVVASLNYIYFLLFLTTALISYHIDTVLIIRDTFPSFIPYILINGLYVSSKAIDLYNFSKYKIHYQKLRIREERKLKTTLTNY